MAGGESGELVDAWRTGLSESHHSERLRKAAIHVVPPVMGFNLSGGKASTTHVKKYGDVLTISPAETRMRISTRTVRTHLSCILAPRNFDCLNLDIINFTFRTDKQQSTC